ncbi:MAG: hypothetical protein V4819_14115 [Verrucomicrobiota bacterium]
MLSKIALTLIFAIASAPALIAETRPWKSADGVRTVKGEFIKRDATSVTIRSEAGKELTIDFSKLHPDEKKWVDNHLTGGPTSAPAPAPPPDPAAFFDNLTFNDTRETTLAKLKASKIVEMTTDETFIGRSGINGIFRTRQKIGSLSGFLYFDWTEGGKLKELTLQTETLPATAYKSEIEPSWKGFVELLTTLYGKPVQKGPLPQPETIVAGSFCPSHLWTLERGGSALLGAARDANKYQLVVRFTQAKVGVVEIP